MELHLTATECHCHLQHGITQCCLPPIPNTSGHTPPDRPILDLPTVEGWKAELTCDWLHTEMFYTHTHRGSPVHV